MSLLLISCLPFLLLLQQLEFLRMRGDVFLTLVLFDLCFGGLWPC